MSTPSPTAPGNIPPFLIMAAKDDLATLKNNWIWFVVLGIVMILVGSLALIHSCFFTVATVLGYGYLMLGVGVLLLIGSFYTGCWGGFFLSILGGILNLAVGFILINHPREGAVIYTLLMAVFFFVEGLFRMLSALTGQYRAWGWAFLSGLVTFWLGVLIWRQWPLSGIWVIGMFLGVYLLFAGWSYVIVGLTARKLPDGLAPAST